MKNILLLIFITINILFADTDGVMQKVWINVPTQIENETPPLDDQLIQEPTVDDTNMQDNSGWVTEADMISDDTQMISNDSPVYKTTTVADEKIRSILDEVKNSKNSSEQKIVTSKTPKSVENEDKFINSEVDDLKGQTQEVLSYFEPIITFIKENRELTIATFSIMFLLLYLLLYGSSSNRTLDEEYEDDDEFEIVGYQNCEKKYLDHNIERLSSKSSILTQNQYSILYGLINESFIHEKEKILFSKQITKERKDREMISLEWKFNHILHFLLPKLSTDNPKHFVEGVKLLLNEEFAKDIVRVSMRDILDSCELDKDNKVEIEKALNRYNSKKVAEKIVS
jgi:hypothetical protein